MTTPTASLIPIQTVVSRPPRDAYRGDGFRNPQLAGTVLLAIAVAWAILGVGASAFAAVVAGGTWRGVHPEGEAEEQVAVLVGVFSAIPLLVLGIVCFTLAAICWLGSIRFRWMAALYAKW
ncbi:MAG: hypothetical protein HKP61_05035 [Dactylosporangium sp.]|nr:hypothetical protein [Dactylosporangium sp.]NNJ60311.1 hypothetical protein [Dactylosporangium sp.]